MCCFSAPTEVHKTNIFARITGADTQAIVYQMQYESKTQTAMILPLPVALPASEATVRWKDLKGAPGFFDDLARGFPPKQDSSWSFSRSKSATAIAEPAIAVHEVGDFIASFVPSVNDFDRLDPRFAISKDVWSKIPEYKDYGFAVFQLKELAGTPHPIAFEFQTRLRDSVFFPTVHIHDGTVHAEDQFDHDLFMQDTRFDKKVSDYDGPTKVDAATGFVRSQGKASTFANLSTSAGLVDGDLLVHRSTIVGMHANKDTIVNAAAISAASGCGRCDIGAPASDASLRLGPASAALAGLAWIIRRRQRVGHK